MVEKQTELENPIHHICKRDLKGAPIKIFAKKEKNYTHETSTVYYT